MIVIRLSDNEEFIKEYYKYLKEFFGIDDDKDNRKTKLLISKINKFNSALCAKMQLLFFMYKYKKDDSAKKRIGTTSKFLQTELEHK